jgi:multiple sugar transport system permease protein
MAAKESMGNFLYNWDKMAAIGVTCVLPVLALVYILQRYIVSGMTMGAVKG